MRALLVAEGLRVSRRRVREMLVRVNPAAAARRWSSTVARRVYHVASPNSLWHIDGNMRLIRLVKLQVVEILSIVLQCRPPLANSCRLMETTAKCVCTYPNHICRLNV